MSGKGLALAVVNVVVSACGFVGTTPEFDGGIADAGPFIDDGGFVRHPNWGPTVHQTDAPPALSGGTLLVAQDGHTAVASDPERDRVVIADLANPADVTAVELQAGDEPGRAAEDGAGRVHVALRSGHALVTVDLATRAIVARREVCAEPRGVAYQASGDLVHVACAGGELVTLPAAGGAATRTLNLGADLRDVVVQGDALWVSVFRSASLLRVGADGTVGAPVRPVVAGNGFEPDVAWRVVARPNNAGMLLLHQLASRAEIVPAPGGYGGSDAGAIVEGAVTMVGPDGAMSTPQSTPGVVLAMDLAVSSDGARMVTVAPGNWMLRGSQVVTYDTALLGHNPIGLSGNASPAQPTGQAVAVAFDGAGHVVVQTREPSALFLADLDQSIPLGGATRADTGHTIFHSDPGGGLACASCHPEGRDDGHVWNFAMVGPRRTQYLRGGLLATAPFHWDGEFSDVSSLMRDVFSGRMSGGVLTPDQTDAVAQWTDALPRLTVSPPADPDAVARGDALFHDATVGCAGCHAGTLLTNNANADVGTGGAFQVPALRNLALRAPYMHTGCAGTLRDRFTTACGGTAHGNTAALSDAQRDDLVAYLQTL